VAVRVRLRLRSVAGREALATALVNTGYEAGGPELLLPRSLAEELGLYPVLPAGSEVREYVLADGGRARLIRIPGALEVSVVTEEGERGRVVCDAVVSEGAEEALISDKLSDALGVAIVAAGEGLWCFRDELGSRVGRSV